MTLTSKRKMQKTNFFYTLSPEDGGEGRVRGSKTSVVMLLLLSSLPLQAEQGAQPPAVAAVATTATTLQQTQTIQTEKKEVLEERAKLFGLTKADWTRYEELMKGPQGFKGANADPVMVLGLFAKTDAERRKYAEISAHNEHKYEQRLWAFTRAFSDAQKRLYGHIPMFNPSVSVDQRIISKPKKPLDAFSGPFRTGDRILYFTEANNCQTCEDILAKLLALVTTRPGLGIDVYVTDSGLNDQLVQQWAVKNKINIKWVQTRVVTLNHEKGELFTIDPTRTAPTTVLRSGNQYFDFNV